MTGTIIIAVTLILVGFFFLYSVTKKQRQIHEKNEILFKEAQVKRQKQIELLEEILHKQNSLLEEFRENSNNKEG